MFRSWYRLVMVTLAAIFALPAGADEMRAFWCDAWGAGFKTPEQTAQLVDFAAKYGFNTIFVQVRKRGDAYYDSSIEPRGSDLIGDYDPLGDVLTQAHKKGIKVHAWIMTYDACTRFRLPSLDAKYACISHPEWISLNDKGEDAYVQGRMYLDPGVPRVREYITSVVREIVRKYPVDGVYIDGLRYPDSTFGYNAESVSLFRAAAEGVGCQVSGVREPEGERPTSNIELVGNPALDDPAWCEWRREQVTLLAKQISAAVRAERPSVQLAISGYWNQKETYERFFQDWPGWLRAGYFDFAVPMVFVPKDVPEFIKMVDDELAVGNGRNVVIGQGTWRYPAETTNRHLRVIRGKGASGFVLFDYAALSKVGKDGKCLADKLRIMR